MSQTDTKIWLLCLLSIDLIVYTPAASFLGNITEADKGQSQNINEIRKNVFKIRKKYFKS